MFYRQVLLLQQHLRLHLEVYRGRLLPQLLQMGMNIIIQHQAQILLLVLCLLYVTAGVTTAAINGLASNTTYYVWVRSVCSTSDKSSWVAAPSFKTLCGSFTSMFENFDSYTTGNIVPDCWERIITTNGTQTISTTTPASGTRNNISI